MTDYVDLLLTCKPTRAGAYYYLWVCTRHSEGPFTILISDNIVIIRVRCVFYELQSDPPIADNMSPLN